jgi:hypothetical protein
MASWVTPFLNVSSFLTILLELSGYTGNWISVSVNHYGGTHVPRSRRSCNLGLVMWFTCHILAFRVGKASHQYDTYNLCQCVYLFIKSASGSQIAPKRTRCSYLRIYWLFLLSFSFRTKIRKNGSTRFGGSESTPHQISLTQLTPSPTYISAIIVPLATSL